MESCLDKAARAATLAAFALLTGNSYSQAILNGTFSAGAVHWGDCNSEIGVSLLYGGGSVTNRVASVNAGLNPLSAADDNMLCQSITGFTVGAIYELAFTASRCQVIGTPSSVSSYVVIDDALEAVVTRSGGWSMSTTSLLFTATQTTQNLVISPGQAGPLGMLFDNMEISLVSMLPVELLYFRAQPQGSGVELRWSTAAEHGSDRFAVERGTDGVNFQVIGETPAAGESQATTDYMAFDAWPVMGTSYYRLKQIDADGTSGLSPVVVVEMDAPLTGITVQDGYFVVAPEAVGNTLAVHSPLGTLLYHAPVSDRLVRRPTLPAGCYIVSVTDRSGEHVQANRYLHE